MNQFDPPYDSPIETDFAWALCKYLAQGVRLEKQYPVSSKGHNYRIDLVASSGGRYVGIELDGAEFHDNHHSADDYQRDANIIYGAGIEVIYRIRGCDVVYRMNESLLLLEKYEPWMFNDRLPQLRY